MTKALPVLALILGCMSSCTQHNPLDCTEGVCTTLDHPFCDVDGTIAGAAHTCIAVSCTAQEFKACRGDDAVICNATGTSYEVTTCERGCDASRGGCVGCVDDTTCMNPAPHCDSSSHECRGCRVDDECASTICDRDTGACLDAASVLYASPSGASSGTCGTQQMPCDFVRAFALLDVTHTVIRLLPGTYNLASLPTLVGGGQTATVYGGGATVNLNGTFAVSGGGRLQLRDMAINTLGTGSLLTCSTPNAAISHLEIVGCTLDAGIGVVLTSNGCDGVIERSGFRGSSNDLIELGGGGSPFRPSNFVIDRATFRGAPAIHAENASTAVITNCVFENAVGGLGGALSAGSPSSLDVSFSTFINSPITECLNVAPGAAKLMKFSNDIMFATSGTSVSNDGTGCTFNYMLMTPQATALTNSSHMTIGVQPRFRDQANADYHLLLGSPAIDTADPSATLGDDYDGVARPQGSQRDMGAFEYKQ